MTGLGEGDFLVVHQIKDAIICVCERIMPPKRSNSSTKQLLPASGQGGRKAATATGGIRKKQRQVLGGGTTPGKNTAEQSGTVVTPTATIGANNNASAKENPDPRVSFEYLKKDMPLRELTDKLLVNKVRVCVDTKFYPFDKYYSRSKYMSGVVQVAFLDMGWGANSWEYAHKRATGMNAVIDVMADRVSDNREKSKFRCKKKFERK